MTGESPKEDPLVEWLAWLMDESIRIGPWAIGLDPLIGLIPGFGDMAGAVVSTLIITRAMQSGIAKSAILRMVINVALDSLAGAVPFFGFEATPEHSVVSVPLCGYSLVFDVHSVIRDRLRRNFLEPVRRVRRDRNDIAFGQVMRLAALRAFRANLVGSGLLGIDQCAA